MGSAGNCVITSRIVSPRMSIKRVIKIKAMEMGEEAGEQYSAAGIEFNCGVVRYENRLLPVNRREWTGMHGHQVPGVRVASQFRLHPRFRRE